MIIISSETYKDATLRLTPTNIVARLFQIRNEGIQIWVRKERINQRTGYKIIISLQTYKDIISCNTATNILGIIIQLKETSYRAK